MNSVSNGIRIVEENFDLGYWPYDLKVNELKKWFRLAQAVKEVENPCYSRKIGVVIVDPKTNALVSSGHNGPPQNCPKNDDYSYLKNVVFPQLTCGEYGKSQTSLRKMKPDYEPRQGDIGTVFAEDFAGCKTCPRRLIDVPSGQRLELCTCIHGEVDAITRANRSVAGCYMVCYCGVPCIECTKVIINSGMGVVFGIDHGRGDYSEYSSRWLFENSRVKLVLVKENWIWKD